jgi:hypothetical protein
LFVSLFPDHFERSSISHHDSRLFCDQIQINYNKFVVGSCARMTSKYIVKSDLKKKKVNSKSHQIVLNDITTNESIGDDESFLICDSKSLKSKQDADENHNLCEASDDKINNTDAIESNRFTANQAILIKNDALIDSESKENESTAKKKRSKSERLRKKKIKDDKRRLSLGNGDHDRIEHRLVDGELRITRKKEKTKNRSVRQTSPAFIYNGIEYCSRGCNTDQEFNPLEEFDLNDDPIDDDEIGIDGNDSLDRDLTDNLEKLFGFKFPEQKSRSNEEGDADSSVASQHLDTLDELDRLNGDETDDAMLRKLIMSSRMNSTRNHSNGFTRLKTIMIIFVMFFAAKWFSKNQS